MKITSLNSEEVLSEVNRNKPVYVLEADTYTKHRGCKQKGMTFSRMYLRKCACMTVGEIQKQVAEGGCFCLVED